MIKLFHADALTFDYSQFKFDAIVSDPPYNINYNTNHKDNFSMKKNDKKYFVKMRNYEPIENENEIDYSFLFDLGIKKMCLFGLNFYIKYIPMDVYEKGSFSIWDKRDNGFGINLDRGIGGKYEMIWFLPARCRDICRHIYFGLFGQEKEPEKKRVHPTQKPVAVMKWCLEKMKLKSGSTIIDPFMGGGNTGLACQALGYDFIGIEKNRTYFEIAERRLLGGFKNDIYN